VSAREAPRSSSRARGDQVRQTGDLARPGEPIHQVNWETWSLDLAGQMVQQENSDRTVTTWAYDVAGRQIGTRSRDQAGTLLDLALLAYDAAGNPLVKVTADGRLTMTYDALNQLSQRGVISRTNQGMERFIGRDRYVHIPLPVQRAARTPRAGSRSVARRSWRGPTAGFLVRACFAKKT
jgi:YD repeat-containing protein